MKHSPNSLFTFALSALLLCGAWLSLSLQGCGTSSNETVAALGKTQCTEEVCTDEGCSFEFSQELKPCSTDNGAGLCAEGRCEYMGSRLASLDAPIGGDECTDSADCDDGNACTMDLCSSLLGRCFHSEKLCPFTEDPATAAMCNPESGECETRPLPAPFPGRPPIPGDCNRDGNITASDALCVLDCAIGIEKEGLDCSQADCDCSGNVSSTDAACALRRAVGLRVIDHCPILPGDCNDDGQVNEDDAACIQACIDGSADESIDCVVAADCDCNGSIETKDRSCADPNALNPFPNFCGPQCSSDDECIARSAEFEAFCDAPTQTCRELPITCDDGDPFTKDILYGELGCIHYLKYINPSTGQPVDDCAELAPDSDVYLAARCAQTEAERFHNAARRKMCELYDILC